MTITVATTFLLVAMLIIAICMTFWGIVRDDYLDWQASRAEKRRQTKMWRGW